jgi:hypothetical protein
LTRKPDAVVGGHGFHVTVQDEINFKVHSYQSIGNRRVDEFEVEAAKLELFNKKTWKV